MTHMRTTIDIDDGLLARAKRRAAHRETTLEQVIEDALRETLRESSEGPQTSPLSTHTFRGRGLQAGRSWDDWSAFRGLAYAGRGA